MAFADKALQKKKEREEEKKKKKFQVQVNLGGKKISVSAPGETLKKETAKAEKAAQQKRAAGQQVKSTAWKESAPVSKKNSGKKAGGAKTSTESAPQRINPFQMPTLPGAQARMSPQARLGPQLLPAPWRDMERSSSNWAYLQNAKTLAQRTHKPQSYIDSLTQKQNALHQANVQLAKGLPLSFQAVSGAWTNAKGTKAYQAAAQPGRGMATTQESPVFQAAQQLAAARREREERLQRERRALPGQAKDIGAAALSSLAGGLHQFNEGFYSTADALLPDNIPIVSDAIQFGKENAQAGAERIREENYARGGTAGVVGDVGASLVSSLPSALAALASGGGSLAAELGSRAGAVTAAAQGILKNPATWVNAMQVYGPEYEKAKESGASDAKAAASALVSTLLQAGIEVAGGMETLGKTAKGAGRYIKSALEEGLEEVAQDAASRSVAGLTYDRPEELSDVFSVKNPDALINPARMAQQAAMGAVVGGLYGAGHAAGARLAGAARRRKNGKTQALKWPEYGEGRADAMESAMQAAGGSRVPTEAGASLRPETQLETIKPEAPEKGVFLPDMTLQAAKSQTPGQAETARTAINTDPRTHTPEQMAQIQEYVDAVDDGLQAFVQDAAEGKATGNYILKDVSPRAAQDIQAITGVDATGFRTQIEPRMITHILERHGVNGAADSSMANVEDIARIQYVLDNYDRLELGGLSDGYREVNPNYPQKSRKAKTVIYIKQINGSYYVVEAVPNSKKKSAYIVSAYIQKNGEPTAPGASRDASGSASAVSMVPQAEARSIHDALVSAPKVTSENDSTIVLPTQSIAHQDAEGKSADAWKGDTGTLNAAWAAARDVQARIGQAEEQMTLTDRDREFVESALRTDSTSNFYEADNPQDVLHLYELRAAEREALAPVREYNRKRQEDLEMQAAQDADTVAEFAKDKKRGLYYQTETPERNLYDIFGKHKDKAEDFIGRYITPVHKAVAEGNRMKEGMRGRVKALKLDKHESAMVQYMLEGQTAGAAAYAGEHGIKITAGKQAKLEKAVQEFRSIYDGLFAQINETQLRNGQEPTRFRKDYAPHFVEGKPDTMLARALYTLGMKVTGKDTLPTDLAGVTEAFRPGKKWFGNLEQRKGDKTVYDAVKGFDQYIETAADVITLTDSIGRIRALEDAIRYRLSDEGTQAKIDAIRADRGMDGLKRRQEIEAAYDENPGTEDRLLDELNRQKQMGMRNFVTELRRYGDSLAGKKHRGDRGIEDAIGRDIYEISRAVEGRIAANMIGANPGSWLTNFIPLTQAMGEVDTASMLKGLYQTVKAYAKDDGLVDASAFLTNRRGSDNLVKGKLRTVGDALGKPMEWIDQFTADAIVRARTAQNMDQNGLDFATALDEADAFAGSLMGDRSKGSMPGVFEMKNPAVKVFTMYQLEVNNQIRYLAKDLPRRLGEEGTAAVVLGLTKVFAGAYLYNALYRELVGRDAALDPVRMIQDALEGVGDEDDESTAADRALELGKAAAEQLPFVGGLLGGGRVPVSSALPNIPNLYTALTDGEKAPEKRRDMLKKELIKPAAYILPPFGGGAVKRAAEGYQTVKQGGAYGISNEGKREMMFPQYGQSPADYAKAMLFGRYSTDEAQDYVESGFQRLSAEDTDSYEYLVGEKGFAPQKAYEAIRAINSTEAPEDGSKTRAQAQRETIMGMEGLSADEKVELSRRLVGGDSMVSFQDADSFRITNEVPESKQAAAFVLMRDYGLSADQAKEYAAFFGDHPTYSESDKTITTTYADGRTEEKPLLEKDSTSVRLQKALDEIRKAPDLSEGQKDGVLRTALLPELGEKYVQSYAGDYVGDIDATRLIDAQAAYERIAGEVRNDTSIHDKNKSEYTRIRFAAYLEDTGLTRAQQDKLWYFQSHGETELTEPWSEIIGSGNEDVQAVGAQIEKTGMDAAAYKAIKAGMDRIYADKDANGDTVKDSKKKKIIAYLSEYPELTDEQKNLLMKADGYKYGMGEKPKKKSSSKSGGKSISKSSASKSLLNGFPRLGSLS